MIDKKPELLAPAGSLDKLKTAFLYGADAVYIGGEAYSLRVAAENFTMDEIKEGVLFAHNLGKKVYLTANIIPHNNDLAEFEKFIKKAYDLGIDAVIISDLGLFSIAKRVAPNLDIHISTQANLVNFETCKAWYNLGAKRVIIARELSLSEIRQIRDNTPDMLEIEAFVHGAMCISYSGRCLLSNYMTERDSNLGACSHPCRWNYSLVEETRPGEYFPVFENERGTFIFNSKDLCMIEHIPELIESGLTSFKIEGRVKTEFYLATVVKAYRDAIDSYYLNKKNYKFDKKLLEELKKVSHRDYTTGFYFGKPSENAQNYETSSYIRNYELLGIVNDYNPVTKIVTVIQKNRFFEGSKIEILCPHSDFLTLNVKDLKDAEGNKIEIANRPQQLVTFVCEIPVEKGSLLRGEKN